MTQLEYLRVRPVPWTQRTSAVEIAQDKDVVEDLGTRVDYETIKCDAVVIGCGIAGNAAALRLANAGRKVMMLAAAEDPHASATYWAQGGIIYKSKDDTPELLAQDVHRAGAGVCDAEAVEKLAVEGPERVEEMLLEIAKVPFTKNQDGEYALTLEASHCRGRILYKADHTGRAITVSMIEAVKRHPLITLKCGRTVFEVVKNDEGECIGVLTITFSGSLEYYRSSFTLLATGGLGDLYMNTSNPEGARGEGVGLASRAGARMKNMQYVQFHPTTLYIPNERRFLLTEALRGEGAILRDRHGRAFAKDYDPAGELSPRDVVARMILAEMEKQNEPCMFLDISHENSDWLKNRFPTIYEHCMKRGIDMTTQPLPVVPAAHYHCGGIEVDLDGCTSIPGLYAAGEVSCTGVHGANRLASTSLLEGLVWGCAAADHFRSWHHPNDSVNDSGLEVDILLAGFGRQEVLRKKCEEIVKAVQRIMWENVGPIRTFKGMARGVEKLLLLEALVERLSRDCKIDRELVRTRNAVRAAKEVAISALGSPLSIGTHYIRPSMQP